MTWWKEALQTIDRMVFIFMTVTIVYFISYDLLPIWSKLQIAPFTTTQFHVLLNSLFKVLFNLPSPYLFAIGLRVIFRLMRSLPHTLGCTPKQPDSREKSRRSAGSLTGLSPSMGYGHSQVGLWLARQTVRRLSQTRHSTRPRWPVVTRWPIPVSFAITKGITVVFFSWAY